ncbi:MAG: hypothetical protein WCF10_14295 [Polyangiales bacterium]
MGEVTLGGALHRGEVVRREDGALDDAVALLARCVAWQEEAD